MDHETHAPARSWSAVASRDHVRHGVSGGFAQAGHGARSPMRRLRPRDWLIDYSPTVHYRGLEPCRSFTAIGRVADREPHHVEIEAGFVPFRRGVAFLPMNDAPIAPLLATLGFTTGRTNRGSTFRFGFFGITDADRDVIAAATGVSTANGNLATIA